MAKKEKVPGYNFKKIEKKWQEYWQKNKTNEFDLDKARKPFYNLMMFPYPSAEGLHVGGVYTFTGVDTYGRFKRMQGYDVFEPIGLDGFGIHSENYAMKIGEHIKDVSKRTEKNFYRQLRSIGNMHDWSRTVETYKPDYYKWTQWLFLQMYKKGLAYRKKAKVNWCPSCKTVLSDEQVIAGKCERCENEVAKKELNQWFFAITKYAGKLLKNLEWIDWSEDVKINQKNWIGKSNGATIRFTLKVQNSKIKTTTQNSKLKIEDSQSDSSAHYSLPTTHYLEVFTTRLDTLFGATYMVVAPEHPLIFNFKFSIFNYAEVEKYVKKALSKSEQERKADEKEKTGAEMKGIKAVNPATGEEIPIFVADYVLSDYGTGAIMAVPAHDERDYAFAKKYKLPIKQVVAPKIKDYKITEKILKVLEKIVKSCEKEKVDVWLLGGLAVAFHCGFIYRKHEDIDLITKTDKDFNKFQEIIQKIGFKKKEEKRLTGKLTNIIFKNKEGLSIDIGKYVKEFNLSEKHFEENFKELNNVRSKVISLEFIKKFKEFQLKSRSEKKDQQDLEYLNGKVFIDDGFSVNSEFLNSLKTAEAKNKINRWLEKNKCGKKAVDYKLRDWCISRQRYWGPPIPIIYCEKCGVVPVPEENLPVKLPEMEDFLPEGKGKGPLAKNEKFVKTKCPICNGPAERETDVSDPFVDSAWYFFRYPSTEFDDRPFDKKRTKKWLPVNSYIGGKEHTVLHLLYSRFITMVLKDLKLIDFDEPYKRFFGHGLITKDGAKMSKSKGNVVNPDRMIEKYGADTMRLYLRFLGDFSQGGDWRDSGIAGMHKFVKRVWTVFYELGNFNGGGVENDSMIDKTVKKVEEDIEKLSFNTAVARIMEFINWVKENEAGLSRKQADRIRKTLALILAPMVPHLAEEFWAALGSKKSIFFNRWPKFDSKKIIDEEIELVIQVNGRVRDRIKVSKDIAEKEAGEQALESEKIKKWTENKKIVKVVFVRGRLVNIVIK